MRLDWIEIKKRDPNQSTFSSRVKFKRGLNKISLWKWTIALKTLYSILIAMDHILILLIIKLCINYANLNEVENQILEIQIKCNEVLLNLLEINI
jgi:hypothetical protein